MYSVKASIVLIVLLVARLAGAETGAWSYDVVKGGKCKQLVQRWQATGVTETSGDNHPGKWAVTTSKLFIGNQPADTKEALDEIEFQEQVKAKTSKNKQTCVVWSGFEFHLHAVHQITALDWQHGTSSNSKCAKEWKRVNDVIHSHEPVHAADVDQLVAAANERGHTASSITGCGKDVTAARRKAAAAVSAVLQKEVAQIRTDADKKAQVRDVETVNMQCPCEEPSGWKLEFDVTVKGEGTKVAGELSHQEWKILQRYTGTIDLTRPVQIPSAAAQAKMIELSKLPPEQLARMTPAELEQLKVAMQSGSVQWSPAGVTSIPLDVEVNSKLSSYFKEPGEADSYEATAETTTWKGNGKDATQGSATLVLDEAAKTYDLDFELKPTSASKQLDKQTKTTIDRTKYGYGGLPTHEAPAPKKSKQPFSSLDIPIVKGTLNGVHVTHKGRPLKIENKSFEFDDNLTPTEPLKLGLPQPDRIKVRIHYRLTQIEAP